MSMETLNRLLSAVNDFDASDLHLVAGVPPAFRVNGEIIIVDDKSRDDTVAVARQIMEARTDSHIVLFNPDGAVAIEHQLILAANGVDVENGALNVLSPLLQKAQPLGGLVLVVG